MSDHTSNDSEQWAARSRPGAGARRLLLRGSLITILLAALAAFVGARLGGPQLPVREMPLSERMFELLDDDFNLSARQRETIGGITERYAPEREQLRMQSRAINVRLAELMPEEQGLGPVTEEVMAELHFVMGERLKLSLQYMLEVRQVLTPEQRVRFDGKVTEEALRSR